MKRNLINTVLLFMSLFATAQNVAKVTEISMKSKYFNHEREILIYTPVGYNEYTANEYDVMYVFDSHERAKFDLVHCMLDFNRSQDPDENKDFIIVGICSPNLPDIDYSRNTDYLPMPIHSKDVATNRGLFNDEAGYGRSGDLKKFLKQELMPYIEKNYRASGRKIGIGHSLSASFVLDCMITDDLFDDYIAISPNYCYDEYRLASDIEKYPFMAHQGPRFIYTSMGKDATSFGQYWNQGWLRASSFFSDKSHFPSSTIVSVKSFPEYDHNPIYIPSITEALKEYVAYSTSLLSGYVSKDVYPVHIELVGQDVMGDVYITGNQEALGNWDPKAVKMKHINDSTCVIDADLHLPAYFKFTRGDWQHQAYLNNAYPQRNIIIYKPEPKSHTYHLEPSYPWTE